MNAYIIKFILWFIIFNAVFFATSAKNIFIYESGGMAVASVLFVCATLLAIVFAVAHKRIKEIDATPPEDISVSERNFFGYSIKRFFLLFGISIFAVFSLLGEDIFFTFHGPLSLYAASGSLLAIFIAFLLSIFISYLLKLWKVLTVPQRSILLAGIGVISSNLFLLLFTIAGGNYDIGGMITFLGLAFSGLFGLFFLTTLAKSTTSWQSDLSAEPLISTVSAIAILFWIFAWTVTFYDGTTHYFVHRGEIKMETVLVEGAIVKDNPQYKRHKNDEYGLIFTYPEDWNLEVYRQAIKIPWAYSRPDEIHITYLGRSDVKNRYFQPGRIKIQWENQLSRLYPSIEDGIRRYITQQRSVVYHGVGGIDGPIESVDKRKLYITINPQCQWTTFATHETYYFTHDNRIFSASYYVSDNDPLEPTLREIVRNIQIDSSVLTEPNFSMISPLPTASREVLCASYKPKDNRLDTGFPKTSNNPPAVSTSNSNISQNPPKVSAGTPCVDTDGGTDAYIRGTVTDASQCVVNGVLRENCNMMFTRTDYCKEPILYEYFCGIDEITGKIRAVAKGYSCEGGCENGKCK